MCQVQSTNQASEFHTGEFCVLTHPRSAVIQVLRKLHHDVTFQLGACPSFHELYHKRAKSARAHVTDGGVQRQAATYEPLNKFQG